MLGSQENPRSMKFKDYMLILGGVILGLTLHILFTYPKVKAADFLYILGVIFNGIILIIVSTALTRSQGNSRSLKEYFIRRLDQIQKDYGDFHEDLFNSKLTKSQVTSKYKLATMQIDQINFFLKSSYKYEFNAQKLNRECHFITSDTPKFDSLDAEEIVEVNSKQRFELEGKLKDKNFLFFSATIKINEF